MNHTNSAIPNPERKYFIEEYFELLEQSEDRYEYHDGEIRMMAHGTDFHSVLKLDTGFALMKLTGDSPCQPYDSDMAVKIPKYNSYLLPDLSFVCEEPTFDSQKRRLLVLTPSRKLTTILLTGLQGQ